MQIIKKLVAQALDDLQLPGVDFGVDHPRDESHGDYSVNAAMILAKQEGKNPRELAQQILEKIGKHKDIENVEVAGPGFINFYLKSEFYLAETQRATDPGYGKNERLKGQKTMVEYTDPNPFKEFHIGHLMSNTVGESLARLFEANGATVKRVNYQGDVGLHVAKSIWGWQNKMAEEGKTLDSLRGETLQVRVAYLGKAYAYGATKYETDEIAKAEIDSMNKAIYDGSDTAINKLYQDGRAWSLEYFETIYDRLGTTFDEYFFESEAGKVGLQVVEEGLKKKVLVVGEEGAVVFRGEQYGLHTRVFRNKLGLPTYEAKDLGLSKTKYGRWEYDKSYIITANEIDEYFKVLLKALSLLYPDLAAKTTHLSHGVMKLISGKMSSRTGKIVTGEGLLDDLKAAVLAKIGEREIADKERVGDLVAVGALKYSVLKQAIGGDIVYEPEKMTNLEGNTGPFVQYTYARAMSILRRVHNNQQPIINNQTNPNDGNSHANKNWNLELGDWLLNAQELSILRWLYRYPEVVVEAGEKYAPHLVATYVYELAQRFNTFYQACRVVDPTSSSTTLGAGEGEVNQLRYLLTQASANVIKSGLGILGIQAPEEM